MPVKHEQLPAFSKSHIVKIIEKVLPDKELYQVVDRGVWVRHNFELVFKDGSRALMKIKVHKEWLDSTVN